MINTRLYLMQLDEKERQWEAKVAFMFIRQNVLFFSYKEIYKQCIFLLRFRDVNKFIIFLQEYNKEDLILFCDLLEKYVNSLFFKILRKDIIELIEKDNF